ncbi:hypothetical protein PSTT_11303 [Puccinia striiformis]|uniref:Secreted protein n=1 Tax=Puccinia striiformis TaxID=27350 RepID=A0A2S4V129_9BASI|nr:hypothetical protein PSTT_11303 [Puccinia striiformis]
MLKLMLLFLYMYVYSGDRHHKRELQKKLMGRGICYHRLSCQSYAPQQHGRGTMADWDQGCNDDPDTDERDGGEL